MHGHEVVLSLGGNRGEVVATHKQAIERIGRSCGRVLCVSRRFWTEAEGFLDDQLFLNMAVLVHSTLPLISC